MVVGQCLVVVALWPLFSCWLSARDPSELLEATCSSLQCGPLTSRLPGGSLAPVCKDGVSRSITQLEELISYPLFHGLLTRSELQVLPILR